MLAQRWFSVGSAHGAIWKFIETSIPPVGISVTPAVICTWDSQASKTSGLHTSNGDSEITGACLLHDTLNYWLNGTLAFFWWNCRFPSLPTDRVLQPSWEARVLFRKDWNYTNSRAVMTCADMNSRLDQWVPFISTVAELEYITIWTEWVKWHLMFCLDTTTHNLNFSI